MPAVCLTLPPSSPSQVRRCSTAAIAGFSAARRASIFTFGASAGCFSASSSSVAMCALRRAFSSSSRTFASLRSSFLMSAGAT